MATSEEKVVLPPFFPLILPACKSAAESFFACFDEKPIAECKKLLQQYEACMVKNGINDKMKMVRVPDPYKKENQ